ncbi:MAG: 3-dehydroquinate synthase family protein, partial [Allosphingosinicella sp.]
LIDPSTLDTLPERQLRAGYAEVVKYGLIGDPDFFAWCEEHGGDLLAGDSDARVTAIETCVRAKAAIVAADERETGSSRVLLNFGHTFGHALEAEAGYSDSLLHGEAVSIGMALAFAFSVERGLCPAQDSRRARELLASAGLPTAPGKVDSARLVDQMAGDKKRAGGRTAFILTRGIGKAFLATDVELAEVDAFLRRQPG